jgi:ubiquitin-conjugating enzyme E2 J1
LSEARELKEATADFAAFPLDDNIFEWHFTLRGPPGTEFERGYYHGRILLPVEYPFRPPDVMILTPNGRFELNKKICLTFTGFHEEMWQPAWGVRTALIGVQAFMGARAEAAVGVGSLDFPTEERERLAGLSADWHCPVCQKSNKETLPDLVEGERVQESLPDGLTIDTLAKTTEREGENLAAAASSTNGSTNQTLGLQPHPDLVIHEAPSFEASQGPTDRMMEQFIRSRLEVAQQHPSIHSSQISTPRSTSPADLTRAEESTGNMQEKETGKGKGKEMKIDQEQSSMSTSTNVQPPPTQATIASTRSPPPRQPFVTFAGTGSAAAAGARSSRQAHQRHARHPSSAEASARRLAALDRAIVTVICLLAALLIRRMLNVWT